VDDIAYVGPKSFLELPPGTIMNLRACVFCSLTLFSISFAPAQSIEDVHVVPRRTVQPEQPKAELQSAADSESLYTWARPFRVNSDLVLVPVTVTDARQRPVMQLSKQDFALYEDEKLQQIKYFAVETEPVSVALLVDVSKSMTDKIETERAAISEFFKNADPHDDYLAITFSDRPRLLVGPTQSIDDLQSKLMEVEPGGSTAMLDAVYLAERQLGSARYNRKVIVIISDGGDNASRYTLREIKKAVQESDVQIYAIGLFETFFFNTLEEKMGKKWLSDSRAKLPETAAKISREIRSAYMLGYRPTTAIPNRWRRIKVQLVDSSPSVHAFRAYYKKGYLTAEQ